jgi:hypothetical protein
MKLELQLYFKNHNDVGSIVYDVKQMIKAGIFEHDTQKLKYRVLLTEEPEYREEVINGERCMILQSKMNRP